MTNLSALITAVALWCGLPPTAYYWQGRADIQKCRDRIMACLDKPVKHMSDTKACFTNERLAK